VVVSRGVDVCVFFCVVGGLLCSMGLLFLDGGVLE
jgi:hypothetical protein